MRSVFEWVMQRSMFLFERWKRSWTKRRCCSRAWNQNFNFLEFKKTFLSMSTSMFVLRFKSRRIFIKINVVDFRSMAFLLFTLEERKKEKEKNTWTNSFVSMCVTFSIDSISTNEYVYISDIYSEQIIISLLTMSTISRWKIFSFSLTPINECVYLLIAQNRTCW